MICYVDSVQFCSVQIFRLFRFSGFQAVQILSEILSGLVQVQVQILRFSFRRPCLSAGFRPLLTYQRVLHLWVRDTLSLTFCVRDAAVVLSTLKRKPVLLVATQLPR